jgi:hypothetical protein
MRIFDPRPPERLGRAHAKKSFSDVDTGPGYRPVETEKAVPRG